MATRSRPLPGPSGGACEQDHFVPQLLAAAGSLFPTTWQPHRNQPLQGFLLLCPPASPFPLSPCGRPHRCACREGVARTPGPEPLGLRAPGAPRSLWNPKCTCHLSDVGSVHGVMCAPLTLPRPPQPSRKATRPPAEQGAQRVSGARACGKRAVLSLALWLHSAEARHRQAGHSAAVVTERAPVLSRPVPAARSRVRSSCSLPRSFSASSLSGDRDRLCVQGTGHSSCFPAMSLGWGPRGQIEMDVVGILETSCPGLVRLPCVTPPSVSPRVSLRHSLSVTMWDPQL